MSSRAKLGTTRATFPMDGYPEVTSASPTLNPRGIPPHHAADTLSPRIVRLYHFPSPIRPTRHVRQPHRVASQKAASGGRVFLELCHPQPSDFGCCVRDVQCWQCARETKSGESRVRHGEEGRTSAAQGT